MQKSFAVVLGGFLAIIVGLTIPRQLWLAAAAGDAAPVAPAATRPGGELFPLHVDGGQLVANGKAMRLRGLDWGWWHLMGTRYSQADMQNVAQWGANVVRLSFSYNDLETDDNPATWKPDGLKDLDEVVQWGKRYGVYVILDMHVAPGGQSTAPYCAGGHNRIWTDAACQERFVALWTEIARRYRDRPEVAAYELMNEPSTPHKMSDRLAAIDQRAINAIRAVDPDKVIVVGGDNGSGPGDLTEALKFADANILYTFHWYLGAGGNEDWISTERHEQGFAGTRDWFKVEKTFTAPAGADHMSVVLRSVGNSGLAWFDDVAVTDAAGKIVASSSFDKDTEGYHPEAFADTMSLDRSIGHDRAGSLSVHGPNEWAGWLGKRLPIEPGEQYHLSAWVKLDNATGDTYLGAMFVRLNTRLDHDAFQAKIQPAVAFARKFNVPVWVGEFGCDTSDKDMQVQWVDGCISLFEKNDFGWTYWNDKETSGPDGMGLQAEHSDGRDYPVNARLLEALRQGWASN